MKATFRYPIVLRHVPKGMVANRYLACTRTVDIDIRDESPDYAPVVIDMRSSDRGSVQPTAYRSIEDTLYAPLAPSKPRYCRLDPDFPAAPLVHMVVAEMKQIRNDKGYSFCLPTNGASIPSNWESLDNAMPDRPVLEDIFLWEARMRELATTFVAVDGKLWKPSPEPFLCVYRNSYGCHVGLVNGAEGGADPYRFHFPVDRISEAREFSIRLSEGLGSSCSHSEFFHDEAFVPDADTYSLDLRMISAFTRASINEGVYKRFRKANTSRTNNAGFELNDLAPEVLEAYATLGKHCERRVSDEDAAAALEQLLEHTANGHSWLINRTAVKIHLEKWNSRPIELALAANPHTARTPS